MLSLVQGNLVNKDLTTDTNFQERGKYRYAITLNPEQPVKTIRVDVYIEEEVPFEVVTVSPFKTDQANKLGDEPPPGTDITLR